MGPKPSIPKRGDLYSIDPSPTVGREMRGRHYWMIVSPEAINMHGVAVAVAINTVAMGARASGLGVRVSGGGVTGIAVCNHVRSFDIRTRLLDRRVTYEGRVDPANADEVAARVASVIDPAPSQGAPEKPSP